jgi:hypothetical protein
MKKAKEKLAVAAEGKMNSLVVESSDSALAPLVTDKIVEGKKADELEELTKKEAEELAKQEKVCETHQANSWAAMKALKAIHDSKLYKGTHSRFKEYCLERWGFDRAHAARVIKASVVYENLECLQLGDIPLPVTEAQVRPIARLTPDKHEEAWKRAVELAGTGRVTMEIAEKAAAPFLPERKVAKKPAVTSGAEVSPPKTDEALPMPLRIKKAFDYLGELLVDCGDDGVRRAMKQIELYVGRLDANAPEANE